MPKNFLNKKELAKKIGENVKYYRNQRGLTLRKLASKTEYTAGYIGLLENGEESPSSFVIEVLAKSLNIPVSYLFEDRKKVDFKTNDPILYSEKIQNYINLFKSFSNDEIDVKVIKAAFSALKPIYKIN